MTKLRNIASGVILDVSQTTEHPDCSYGQPIWIDESNNALCQVGMEAPFYEVLQYDGKDNRLRIGKELERLRKAKKFILVGDHQQLPPIVDNTVLSKMTDYNKKDLEKDKDKFEKLRRKGKLTPEEELKWREKILKKENKALELQLDLEKAENKLRKLD